MLSLPGFYFLPMILCLWLAARLGMAMRNRWPLPDPDRDHFSVVQAASLTLLGLIIGFSFSMSISRYDLRKNYEEAEANAIGTEFVRAGLLPDSDATQVRSKLRTYITLRISYYQSRDAEALRHINAETAQLQTEMWSAVQTPALEHPTPVMALAVSGMNDVLNAQGYTQAAWWNRIPTSAWGLLIVTAICCNLLVGYGRPHDGSSSKLLLVLPIVTSIAFLLIADIDAPRGELIHIAPQNLMSLVQALSHP
jgi:hypothetical protein